MTSAVGSVPGGFRSVRWGRSILAVPDGLAAAAGDAVAVVAAAVDAAGPVH